MSPTKAKAYLMNINSIADWLSGRVAALILMILSLDREAELPGDGKLSTVSLEEN